MLKEQIARIFYGEAALTGDMAWKQALGIGGTVTTSIAYAKADQILNLFKAEIDKLTVIGNGEVERELVKRHLAIENGYVVSNPLFRVNRKIQLQHTKKQLLDLMRGVS